jgi:acetylornithine deacetylase
LSEIHLDERDCFGRFASSQRQLREPPVLQEAQTFFLLFFGTTPGLAPSLGWYASGVSGAGARRAGYGLDVAEITARLVGFDTTSERSNLECAQWLAGVLEGGGAKVRLHHEEVDGVAKAHVLGTIGPPEPGGVLLCGHLDTVPWTGQVWRHDPLRLTIVGDRLVGRGVADMKAFLAQAVVAMLRLEEGRLVRPVVLLATCDEEVGCSGAARLAPFLADLLAPLPLPAEAWLGEPTSFAAFRAHKGNLRFEIEVRGRGGHSSRPDLGANAIAAMGEVLGELAALDRELLARATPRDRALFPDWPFASVNAGVVAGGSAPNVIPESCRLEASWRLNPGMDGTALLEELRGRLAAKVLPGLRGRAGEADVAVRLVSEAPAMCGSGAGPLARSLAASTGTRELLGAPFATDGGHLARLGVDCVVCGPGELEAAHRPDESMPVESLYRGLALIETVLPTVCCGP